MRISLVTFGLALTAPCLFAGDRLDDLVHQLSTAELANLCAGATSARDAAIRFQSGGIARLGIPPLVCTDGPVGVRAFDDRPATSLPCTLSLAATWDREAAREYGKILGEETRDHGAEVVFGPGLDLMRDPRGGRNFEYMGEDPWLAGTLGAEYIQGVQATGVGACAKHFAANDCEQFRHFTNSRVDERTLHEVQLLAFQMAVQQGHVWSIMAGNNSLNGEPAAENATLLDGILKHGWGFDGVVVTDWRAAYRTVPAANSGMDITMGLCAPVFGDGALAKAVDAGQVSRQRLEEMARRILLLYQRVGLLDTSKTVHPAVNLKAHHEAARRLAAEGMVLLKNRDGILPLELPRRVAILGPGADRPMSGKGSSAVGSTAVPTVAREWENRTGFEGKVERVAWTNAQDRASACAAAAGRADVAIFFAVDAPHGESNDLKSIALAAEQEASIAACAAANPRTIVVVQSGEPILFEAARKHAAAVLASWYAGEGFAEAIVDVLTGKAEPTGRLPATWAQRMEDYPCAALGVWPARKVGLGDDWDAMKASREHTPRIGWEADYKEGVFIGYRWFDEHAIEPAYPFGFGLGYTTFELSGGKLEARGEGWVISCDVHNTGRRAGAEVVQLYVGAPGPVPRPVRELKGFQRVNVRAGGTERVSIPVRRSDLAYWDVGQHGWRVAAGRYVLWLGSSSRELPVRMALTVGE